MATSNRPVLDFLVIGAQKAGTTSLWRYLRAHPRIRVPASKEVPFFNGPDPDPALLSSGADDFLGEAKSGRLRGKVTPGYMIGGPGVGVDLVARRIASMLPGVKLIAVLRDPVERALSSYTMAVRRGQETRSADAALTVMLEPERLEAERADPSPAGTHVVAGEYGRILSAYRAHFPAGQIWTGYSEDLGRDPAGFLDAILGFLGLPTGYRPENLGRRYFAGGTRRLLEPEAEKELRRFHEEDVLPRMTGSPTVNRAMFAFFHETWNVRPDDDRPTLSRETEARLRGHFRRDAELLTELGVRPVWVDHWDRDQRPGSAC